MSSNAPQIQQPDDPWTPKRVHGGFRHVYRAGKGKNRHWEFKGQQPDETVKTVLRKHVWFLITPAFPLIASIVGLLLVFALSAIYPSEGSLWLFLEVIFGILIFGTLVYFLYNDLALWWVETYIITNKRVMIWKGLLNPSRQEANIEQVVQVGSDQTGILSLLIGYGNVHLYLVGGKGLALDKIPNPKKVRDLFNKVTVEAKRSKPPKETYSEPVNQDLLTVLSRLSEKEPLPTLPNPDKNYPPRSDGVRGPLRRFGGPLGLYCDVAYTTDEETVLYIQRAKSVLVIRLILPILIVLGLIISMIYFTPYELYIAIAILVMFFVIAYLIINYIDDVYILTTKRVIDINRQFIFFDEEHIVIEYGQIKDVQVKVGNPLFLAMDVGHVIVETPGNNPDIDMDLVNHPFSIQDMVFALKGHKEKVDKIKNKNERKEELNLWFGTVLSTMEQKVVGRGVPNLQKLDLWTAAERARQFGMNVVPVGEDPSYPNIEPGLIVSQNPIPGTLVQFESDNPEERPKIRVILSRRP